MNKLDSISIDDLNVIYEDNHIIVVVKPISILSQADKSCDMDMLTLVKAYLKQKHNKPGDVFLGLVHRLDTMVGGVMVFAKTSKGASRLSESIRNKQFVKKYYAIVNGKLDLKSNVKLQNWILKDPVTNMSKVVPEGTKDAKLAILEYSAIKNYIYNKKDYTLLDINLLTGRHHQIRVQLANISHPIYGDTKYGKDENIKSGNIALFSYYLSFPHPTLKNIMEFQFKPNNIVNNSLYKKDKIWDVIK